MSVVMCKHTTMHGVLVSVFAVSFFVLHWLYGYVIEFQSETNDCFFLFGRPFLGEFLDHPAGPLRYAARFLGQFYYHRWLGAVIVSADIACCGFLFHRILAKRETTMTVAQTLLPCVLLLALHTSTLYVLHDTLGLCVSSSTFLGYLSMPGNAPKRIYALAATPLVYFLAGFHVWILVIWILACEWLDGPLRSGLAFKIGYVLFSIVVPLVAWRWVFLIPLRNAFLYPLVLGPPVRTGWSEQTSTQFAVDCGLAILLGGLMLLLPFWGRLWSGVRLATFWQAKPHRRSRVGLAIAVSAVVLLVHWIRYDAPLATVVACRQLYKARQWDALLELARDNPYGDLRVQFMTNLALCHQGRLLDEMFHYPQPWGTRGLFLNFSGMPVASPDEDDSADGMYNSDLLYEMGHANYAFRHAYNCLCLQGKTYESLQRMAQCAMLNGNSPLAEKYLNLLAQTLFHRDVASRYKALIADPDAAEREFGELRKCLPTVDGFGHPVRYFATLLESKPDNRMARDYLMAWLLLDKRQDSLAAVCADVGHLRTAGYDSLPTHCQEAMVLRQNLERTRVDTQGFHYDQAIVTRVDGFCQDLARRGVMQNTGHFQAVYGDTYMFYFFFVTTPDHTRNAQPDSGFRGQPRVE